MKLVEKVDKDFIQYRKYMRRYLAILHWLVWVTEPEKNIHNYYTMVRNVITSYRSVTAFPYRLFNTIKDIERAAKKQGMRIVMKEKKQ